MLIFKNKHFNDLKVLVLKRKQAKTKENFRFACYVRLFLALLV